MPDTTSTKETLLFETSTVRWHELQRLFASGVVLSVASDLDLIDIAQSIADDDTSVIEPLIKENKLGHISNDQAREWYEENRLLWSVVVKPWVLVQDKK